MKFQDDISSLHTYVRTYIHTYIHTNKPKPICPRFFNVGGIKRVKNDGDGIRTHNPGIENMPSYPLQ